MDDKLHPRMFVGNTYSSIKSAEFHGAFIMPP